MVNAFREIPRGEEVTELRHLIIDCIISSFLDYISRVRILIRHSVGEYRMLCSGGTQVKILKMIVLCTVYF